MPERKIRILMILRGLDIGRLDGGRERFGIDLARQLDKQLTDVSICVFWHRGTKTESYWQNVLMAEKIPVFFAAHWNTAFELSEFVYGAYCMIKHYKRAETDIVHSQYQFGTLIAVLLKTFGYSRKAIRTVHTSSLELGEWGQGFGAWICRQVFTNLLFPFLLDAEIGISQAAVDSLKRRWGARIAGKPVLLVRNGIREESNPLSEARAIAAVALPAGKLIVGSVGRLTKQKGYIYLIDAMPRVIKEMPNVFLVLVGDGELRAELEKRVLDFGIEDKVLFAGQQNDVTPFLSRMELFVLPSLWEGLPTAVLESIACGVPVVATDIAGTQELIQDGLTGWLVRPKNPIELASSIVEALRSSFHRKEYSTRARESAADLLMTTAAKKHVIVYESLLNSKSLSSNT
jgi:glycosyltransferase involved in cell wall biosynthesis